MNTKGPHLKATLDALNLEDVQRVDAIQNAERIVSAIAKAYGTDRSGKIDPSCNPASMATGLVYGRIQSGKTRAMIASTAMAFDNNFRIAVVMTSNINDLVDQTHMDFSAALPGQMIFTKDSDLEREVQTVKLHMEKGAGCLLLICSKGKQSLENVSSFFARIGAKKYPAIIFDDEGDQASLDTNTNKRSKSNIRVAPSAINQAIQEKLRAAIPRHVYVSVTGTPQAVLLQSAESTHRPSFIEMLPPGRSYVGGDAFFAEEEPEDNKELIALVNPNEKAQLIQPTGSIPDGLQKSILFFLVSASAAMIKIGMKEKGYSYLCHPSLKNAEQAIAEQRINDFLFEVLTALYKKESSPLLRKLQAQYRELCKTLGAKTPPFNDLKLLILQQLPLRKILVINAKVKRNGIDYGRGLNFLIGGNTLGRGIAIRDLLVTYYVRASQVSQIDTMHQHARMYGYRKDTLGYTRVFITRELYYRFRDIYHSDEDLRSYIDRYKNNPSTFPIEYQFNLRATRRGVLDVTKTDTLSPGKQIYPNYIVLPQGRHVYSKIFGLLETHFGLEGVTEGRMANLVPEEALSPDEAIAIVKLIKTGSKNTWRDATIADVIRKVAEKFDGQILLRFRTARRKLPADGFMSTGVLSGDELRRSRRRNFPTLWVVAVKTQSGGGVEAGMSFMYATLVIPDALPALFMFNRGA